MLNLSKKLDFFGKIILMFSKLFIAKKTLIEASETVFPGVELSF